MASDGRRNGRTWMTEQLLSTTRTSIYAVKWYELATSNTSEIEVLARGQLFLRQIENAELEGKQGYKSLKQTIEELAIEIDETP
jgi:hypothetical protein